MAFCLSKSAIFVKFSRDGRQHPHNEADTIGKLMQRSIDRTRPIFELIEIILSNMQVKIHSKQHISKDTNREDMVFPLCEKSDASHTSYLLILLSESD